LQLESGNYVRVTGTGVAVSVLGQTLSGNFAIKRDGSELAVHFDNGELGFGDGTHQFVRVTDATGDLSLKATGISGSFSANIVVDVPGVKFDSQLSVELDTAASKLKISSSSTHLTIAGQEIGGSFSIQQYGTGANRFTAIAIKDLTLKLGDPNDPIVEIKTDNHVSGALLLTSLGIAAQFSASSSPTFNLPSVLSIAVGSFAFKLNTSPVPVDKDFSVKLPDGTDATVPLHVGAGPLLFVEVTDVDVCVAGTGDAATCTGGVKFHGNFKFDQSSKPGFTSTAAGLGSGAMTSQAVADVNHDGSLDLVTGADGTDNVLYLNKGDGTYTVAASGLFPAGTSDKTTAVALADVTGDGWADFVEVNDGTSHVYVNRGGASATATGGVASGATRLVVSSTAGFDPTGKITIDGETLTYSSLDATSFTLSAPAASNHSANSLVRQWRGFAGTATDFTTAKATSVAVGDINGDGFADIVVGSNPGGVDAFLNEGVSGDATTGFTWSGLGDAENVTTDAATAVALGDLNGDNLLDLVVGKTGGSTVVYLNQGIARTTLKAALSATSTDPIQVDSTDGFPSTGTIVIDDESIGYTSTDATHFQGTITRGAGDTHVAHAIGASVRGPWQGFDTAAPVTLTTSADASALALVDLDGDGKRDVVIATNGKGTTAFLNTGAPGAAPTFDSGHAVGDGSDANTSLAAGDVDGDGTPDLIVGSTGTGHSTHVFLNQGSDGGPGTASALRSTSRQTPTPLPWRSRTSTPTTTPTC
jgi:hypothetical protein